ncbi:hypothetical protein GSF70_03445 [Flavobacteriaceae bacterium W22]|uniref:Uncharacterized protein n=1 Tax=Chryseobacterium piscium TaxID=333702 RepID=A0A3D9BB20_9FLAO|nr:hypothetical protein [Chryseobacterium piscium]MXS70261.1 hypothetical protein [Flavobacteriaceae bacterium W22]REC50804.1 hypothetical protein DRF62_18595 [Chryseobacterium piscium]
MKNRLTQVQKQENYLKDVKERFCKHFDCTDLQYCENEFKQGLLWIENNGYPESFSYSKTFWNWFKIEMAELCESCINQNKIIERSFKDFRPFSTTLKQIENEAFSTITQKTV